MSTPRRRWAFALRALFVLVKVIAVIATMLIAVVGYRIAYPDRSEMLRATLIWGRLAPLPASAKDFAITTEGSPFTRAFRASFSGPIADIEKWLRDSPGTRDVAPKSPTPTTRKYLITPGGGAQHAEVNVDDSSGSVEIYVYWS